MNDTMQSITVEEEIAAEAIAGAPFFFGADESVEG